MREGRREKCRVDKLISFCDKTKASITQHSISVWWEGRAEGKEEGRKDGWMPKRRKEGTNDEGVKEQKGKCHASRVINKHRTEGAKEVRNN